MKSFFFEAIAYSRDSFSFLLKISHLIDSVAIDFTPFIFFFEVQHYPD